MQGRKVIYIDVSKMSLHEAEQVIETLRLIHKYKLHCPRLLKALSHDSDLGKVVLKK
jgi:hypothetical protein